jgi:hypothetical protein
MAEISKQQERRDRFVIISKVVREESMKVNSEFSEIEYEPED